MFHLMIVGTALLILSVPGVVAGILEHWFFRKKWKIAAIFPVLIAVTWVGYLIGYGTIRPDLHPSGNGLWDMVRIWILFPITIGTVIGAGIAALKNRQESVSGGI